MSKIAEKVLVVPCSDWPATMKQHFFKSQKLFLIGNRCENKGPF